MVGVLFCLSGFWEVTGLTGTEANEVAQEAIRVLNTHTDWVACPSTPTLAIMLSAFGVPSDRMIQLACLWDSKDRIVYLSKHQVAYYRAQEQKILRGLQAGA